MELRPDVFLATNFQGLGWILDMVADMFQVLASLGLASAHRFSAPTQVPHVADPQVPLCVLQGRVRRLLCGPLVGLLSLGQGNFRLQTVEGGPGGLEFSGCQKRLSIPPSITVLFQDIVREP